jgi:ABC-2 type transport system permease protein
MVLQIGENAQLMYPSGDLSEADVRSSIEATLRRASPGFLNVVGLWAPPDTPTPDPFGNPQPSFKQYNAIAEQLRRDYTVRNVDLSTGQVPAGIDLLVVIAPQGMTDTDRYAIDQFLMRGGSVVVAAGNYIVNPDQFTGNLGVQPVSDGLRDMLASYGITVEESMVLDPQNEPFPVQIARNVGGLQVREIQALDYPFFVDIRADGMDRSNPILASLPAVTMNWVSPITVDEAQNAERQVEILLQSSPGSWLRTNTDIQPNQELYPELGFPVEGEQKSYPLAVAVQGRFESFFKGKPSPLEAAPESSGDGAVPTVTEPPSPSGVGTIESSPETARLIVVGSAEFMNDLVFNLSSSLSGDRYQNSLQFMQNAVDWSVEDLDLLTIRSRGSAARVLAPLNESQQSFWEYLNYGLALVSLVAIGLIWRTRQQNERPMELIPPARQQSSRNSDQPQSASVAGSQ